MKPGLDRDSMKGLDPSAQTEVGRCWNAYVRYRRAEYEERLALNEFRSSLIRLRAVYRVSVRRLEKILGLHATQIRRWTMSYRDPKWRPGQPMGTSHAAAGSGSVPGQEPSLARIERNARAVSED